MSFDPQPYAEGIIRLNEAEAEEIRARASMAREEARALARAIRGGDGEVRSVYLFGSLAEGEPRHLGFDIDLAIDGGDLYRALDIVEGSSFHVDLVDLALVPADLATRIRERGVRLC
jgi:predicted nucleotidyltransferase